MMHISHLVLYFRSMSMTDMRDEDEAILQPHSHVRHEMMHNQYNRIKEEDNHWQDVSLVPSPPVGILLAGFVFLCLQVVVQRL